MIGWRVNLKRNSFRRTLTTHPGKLGWTNRCSAVVPGKHTYVHIILRYIVYTQGWASTTVRKLYYYMANHCLFVTNDEPLRKHMLVFYCNVNGKLLLLLFTIEHDIM